MLNKLVFLICFTLLCACKESPVKVKGEVKTLSLYSEILKRDVEFTTYRPTEVLSENEGPDLIYLLHGHGGDHEDWFQPEEGNAGHLLDSLISVNAIPPLAAVSVNAGNSWYVDSVEEMERFYLEEFMPYVENAFGFSSENQRYIAGNSAGGYGSLRFALSRPELFEAVILLSPASYEPLPPAISSSRKVAAFAKDGTFNDSVWSSYSYKKRVASFLASEKKPKIYMSVGDDDAYNIVPVVSNLQQLFLENKIPNELRVTDGGHDWQCWQRSFVNFLTEIHLDKAN